MSAWIWVLIPIVAIIGGYIIDYQKNKLKWQNQTSSNESELEEIRLITQQLKKRIENLEAIAASEPDQFSNRNMDPLERIEMDGEVEKTENKNRVAHMATKKENG